MTSSLGGRRGRERAQRYGRRCRGKWPRLGRQRRLSITRPSGWLGHGNLIGLIAHLFCPLGRRPLGRSQKKLKPPGHERGHGHHDKETNYCMRIWSQHLLTWKLPWLQTDLQNTAMILATSTPPMGGLRGSKTNDGTKKTLIQRRAQPACSLCQLLSPTLFAVASSM